MVAKKTINMINKTYDGIMETIPTQQKSHTASKRRDNHQGNNNIDKYH